MVIPNCLGIVVPGVGSISPKYLGTLFPSIWENGQESVAHYGFLLYS